MATSALGAMVGVGGDIFIHDTSTQTAGIVFSHLYITADAVINEIKVGDIVRTLDVATLANVASVKTTRKYTGTIPTGYLICAGENKGIHHSVCLTSGSVEGIIFKV
jgi:hypothetical protein